MKKIMFNSKYGLDKAVLEGRKTMTRRIINPQPAYDKMKGMYWKGGYYGIGFDNPNDAYKNFISGTEHDKSCNRYRVGEVIAIAQSSRSIESYLPLYMREEYDGYSECLDISFKTSAGWDNKMFVKARLMPWAIKITNVKVERLQDITSEDCLREGIMKVEDKNTGYCRYGFTGCRQDYPNPLIAFKELWRAIDGKDSFHFDQWVWVYEFELTDNPNKS